MITPDSARSQRLADSELTLHEKNIDKYLSSRYPNDRGEWWISMIDVSHEVRSELVVMYSKLWNARIEYDQRDGDALVISEKASQR